MVVATRVDVAVGWIAARKRVGVGRGVGVHALSNGILRAQASAVVVATGVTLGIGIGGTVVAVILTEDVAKTAVLVTVGGADEAGGYGAFFIRVMRVAGLGGGGTTYGREVGGWCAGEE